MVYSMRQFLRCSRRSKLHLWHTFKKVSMWFQCQPENRLFIIDTRDLALTIIMCIELWIWIFSYKLRHGNTSWTAPFHSQSFFISFLEKLYVAPEALLNWILQSHFAAFCIPAQGSQIQDRTNRCNIRHFHQYLEYIILSKVHEDSQQFSLSLFTPHMFVIIGIFERNFRVLHFDFM